ncbi:MAG: glycerophosphodiester phosphodiesterase family protein [Gammaproteobacteria bacterium]
MTIIIGHRGACGYAPENTLASFQIAKNLHLQWVEFDVMLAKCGTPIIMHDYQLDRTTDGKGEVADYDYEQLIHLDAGSWFDKQYAHEKIMTLSHLLRFLESTHISSVIEIKPYPGFEIETAKATVAALTSYSQAHPLECIISSFSLDSLKTVRDLMPKQAIAFALDHHREDLQELNQAYHFHSVHLAKEKVTEEIVKQVHAMGLQLFTFTVNDDEQAKSFIKLGVDGIFSDFPDRLTR